MGEQQDSLGGDARVSRRFERARIEARLFAEVCEILLSTRACGEVNRFLKPQPRPTDQRNHQHANFRMSQQGR
jgi:hypothetical protein